ncbi:uncharacterized protein K02A2.6-like [Asterias rubens]|uniref:uncharacterized protein K02A2.6-like n=1 Tax=Asterias rubens TaxID=7604 RepID=UPI001455A083|nr:uncharacterized protein K02A2.6-like [Asterias rubens]
MNTFGNIGEFQDEKDSEAWPLYVERLKQFFEANDVEDAGKQRAILLSVCGADTYKLISSLVAPEKPGEKTFDELISIAKDHFNPLPSVIVQRYKFNTRIQQQGETTAEFVAELRRLARHCEYGSTLEDMLRDRLVCGLKDERVQRRLLSEPSLKFKKAWEISQAMELAMKNAKDLQRNLESLPVPVAAGPLQQANKVASSTSTRGPNQTRPYPQQAQPHKQGTHFTKCYRCGRTDHSAIDCRVRSYICHNCGKQGHLAKVCRGGKSSHTPVASKVHTDKAYCMEPDFENPVNAEANYTMYKTSAQNKEPPLIANVLINKCKVSMEIDTGASVSIMSETTYDSIFKHKKPSLRTGEHVELRTYTGQKIPVVGTCSVTVEHNDQKTQLSLLIVSGQGPNLLGRDWLRHLKLAWQEIHHVRHTDSTAEIMNHYEELFRDDLGKLKGQPVKINIKTDAKPKFCKARTVPFSMKKQVEDELDRLQKSGVIEPVTFSRWAAPIVPVIKENGQIRICGDYKATVNQAANVDSYPVPRVEELFAAMSGGQTFSKLDLSHAYLQLVLDEPSRELATINTHRGLFQYTRMPFGISAAPAIFQRTIESLLADIPQAVAFLDDILVTGKSESEHIANLDRVLTRLQSAGLRLKQEKCKFFAPEVVYLGHRINATGLHPTMEKVQAIKDAPVPRNVTELKSYLGILNYYAKFLPNLSSLIAPLHCLLRKDTRWSWDTAQDKAFRESKELLVSAQVLVHYNPEKELVLSCDASPYGVGAVLANRMADGTEHPIAYASRSLSPPERNYSQLDKEGLAMVFGVKKFHQYVYGRKFVISTDHKPLLGLLGEGRMIPPMASSRIQRWALTLSAYDYQLVYKPGSLNGNADALSRLPLPHTPSHVPVPADYVMVMDHMESTPVSPEKIRLWTGRDPVLSQVRSFVMNGWPAECANSALQPYICRKTELSIQDGCIMWGSRVVIPPQGRQRLVEELHESHPGVSCMKSLGRSYVWWPCMDKDIESKVKQCSPCQTSRQSPPVAPLHPWEWPQRPWSRLHVDYAGPFMGRMFLIIVDAHSKWLDIHAMHSATSLATVEKLRQTFATHGLPDIIVSDNGSNFTSAEFQEFLRRNGIKHVRSAPFHPSSNGLAERAVQSFKAAMRRMNEGTVETKLSRFLFTYRTTPHATTGISPAQLLMNRRPQTRLDLVRPDLRRRVTNKQCAQKEHHDKHAKPRSFHVNDTVYVHNYAPGPRWMAGRVVSLCGHLMYTVRLEDGRVWRRHIDQMRFRYVSTTPSLEPNWPIPSSEREEMVGEQPLVQIDSTPSVEEPSPMPAEQTGSQNTEPDIELRRSTRVRTKPELYGFPDL